MADKTKIEWTDATWNPVSGCSPVSEGCEHCYALRILSRFKETCDIKMHPKRLEAPVKWKRPRRIFLCSMGDLFHEKIDDLFRDRVFQTIEKCPQHTFQILTKRPHIARDYFWGHAQEDPAEGIFGWNILKRNRNVWLGVTAENQALADERIPILLEIPAAVRFISIEPMLGPIDLSDANNHSYLRRHRGRSQRERVDWVICGAESGPYHRPCEMSWVRAVRDECQEAGIPFYFKQRIVAGEKVTNPELDGRTWEGFPEGDVSI